MFDWMVVGAGFAGAVVAERLARVHDQRVVVVEKRSHIGGNAWDEHDAAGILVHRYGPHIFHTNAPRVVEYLSGFTEWRPYEHRVLTSVDGQLLPMPINLDTVNRLYGMDLDPEGLARYLASVAEPVEHPRTSEEVVVSSIGRDLYERFYRGYTRKQWGVDPSELDASVAARVPARTTRDDRYFTDRYQQMPRHGYGRLFRSLLDHPNITVLLDTDFEAVRERIPHRRLVYTGPVDLFFGQRYGPLPYRSLRFEFETLQQEWAQPVATINHPNEHAYTRVTEFKHLTGQRAPVTTLVYEYPQAHGDPYYPVPAPGNRERAERYAELAEAEPDTWFVGRLATYRYYNMDQVVAQALTTVDRITAGVLGPPARVIGASATRSRPTPARGTPIATHAARTERAGAAPLSTAATPGATATPTLPAGRRAGTPGNGRAGGTAGSRSDSTGQARKRSGT
jgi:UDP-galactopyranose mutase